MTQRLPNDCFALPPGVHWTPVEEALARLEARLSPIAQAETVPLARARGRLLAAPVRALRGNPPTANAAVDGYGFAAAHSAPILPLAGGRAAAGAPFGRALPPGEAVRILTGAALPDGVDTIVLQEDVRLENARVHLPEGWKAGANTRPAGEDFKAGATLLEAGHRLRAQDLALLAAGGAGRCDVFRPLRVAVLSTGDELRAPGAEALPHQIWDANRPMLAGLIEAWGAEMIDLGQAADTRSAVIAALDAGAKADLIVTTGGASAGDEDHVSAALREAGAIHHWRIAMKPGRPLALGVWDGVPVFGLPGNPVAAFVTALIFLFPAVQAMGGAGWRAPEALELPASFSKRKKAGRREYLRARLRGGAVEVFASEGSGRISGLSWAEGLAELPDEAAEIRPGSPIRYLPFAAFGI